MKRFSAMLESLTQNWWFSLGCRPEVVLTHCATCDIILSTATGRGETGAGPSSSMDGSGSELTVVGGGSSVCGCCSWSCCCCGGTAGRRGRGNEDIYVIHIGRLRLQAQPPPQLASWRSMGRRRCATRAHSRVHNHPTGSRASGSLYWVRGGPGPSGVNLGSSDVSQAA